MEVDRDGVLSKIKLACIMCNPHLMDGVGERCESCPFIKGSRTNKGNRFHTIRTRTACSSVFKQYGILDPGNTGKDTLFWHLYHSGNIWIYPTLPQVDNIGNYNTDNPPQGILLEPKKPKKFQWHVAHLNGLYWDDSYGNIHLMLNTEHTRHDADYRRKEAAWARQHSLLLEGIGEF